MELNDYMQLMLERTAKTNNLLNKILNTLAKQPNDIIHTPHRIVEPAPIEELVEELIAKPAPAPLPTPKPEQNVSPKIRFVITQKIGNSVIPEPNFTVEGDTREECLKAATEGANTRGWGKNWTGSPVE